MISYDRFGKLRLAQFRADEDIDELSDWEFMDALWVGESVGFSEWLRLESDPDVLRSLAIDFSEFPEPAAQAVLQAIDLPVRAGMTYDELHALFGAPVEEHRFVKGRVSYEFVSTGPPEYEVSCTLLDQGGLTYLVVMRPMPNPPSSS